MDAGVGIHTRGRKKVSVPGCWACLPSAPLSGGQTGEMPDGVPGARPPAVAGGVEREGKASGVPWDRRLCLRPAAAAPSLP